jgi:heat shock protein HtpX
MYSEIAANKRKTLLLMFVFVGLVSAIAYAFSLYFGDQSIVVYALVFSVIYSLVSYFASAKIALGMSGAKPIAKRDAPELYRIVENLTIAGGMPMPQVYIINDPAPNAFATGRDPKHSYIAVTTGLLEILDKTELEGVIAHELSHVKNYDIRVMAITAALVSLIAIMSDFLMRMSIWGGGDEDNNSSVGIFVAIAVAIITPLIAMLVQLAVSRKREFLADASGAELTRYPEGLAGALRKLQAYSKPMQHASSATSHLFISNPLGRRRSVTALLSTHPPLDERIARLERMKTHA